MDVFSYGFANKIVSAENGVKTVSDQIEMNCPRLSLSISFKRLSFPICFYYLLVLVFH